MSVSDMKWPPVWSHEISETIYSLFLPRFWTSFNFWRHLSYKYAAIADVRSASHEDSGLISVLQKETCSLMSPGHPGVNLSHKIPLKCKHVHQSKAVVPPRPGKSTIPRVSRPIKITSILFGVSLHCEHTQVNTRQKVSMKLNVQSNIDFIHTQWAEGREVFGMMWLVSLEISHI